MNFTSNKIVTRKYRTSLVVQWLEFCASTAWNSGSIPGRRTKILHVSWHGLCVCVCVCTYKHMGTTSDCVAGSGGRDPITPGIMLGTEELFI